MTKKYDPNNLVAIVYAYNTCYAKAIEITDKEMPKDVTIDPDKGTWTGPVGTIGPSKPQTLEIGRARYIEKGCRHGIIGVYDRTKIEHLDSMVHDVKAALSSTSSAAEEY